MESCWHGLNAESVGAENAQSCPSGETLRPAEKGLSPVEVVRSDRHHVESCYSCLNGETGRPIEEGLSQVGVTASDYYAGFADGERRLALWNHGAIVHDFGPLDEVKV